MALDQHLVLARYYLDVFGFRRFEEVQEALGRIQEGPRGDGNSHFFAVLASRTGCRLPPDDLARLDRNVLRREAFLRRSRRGFTLKYFQYFSLLQSECHFERLARDPVGLRDALNAWRNRLRQAREIPAEFKEFGDADLWRVAFFLATGGGKTLLMHAHTLQVAEHLVGGSAGSLFARRSGPRTFDHVLLVTPGEGLSGQHLRELAESGIPAVALVEARRDWERYRQHVKVVEIHKLAERAGGDGLSIELDELGKRNLVLVDEGHKGTGSEAQTWKSRQRALSVDGLLLEYSATFAQAVESAPQRARTDLLVEYGKAIISDYSYRYFHADGFGKDFEVLNVSNADEEHASSHLVGGLLLFYAQHRRFAEHGDVVRRYQVEAPLWVFVGSSVNAVRSVDQQKQSDVATVVRFLRRYLRDEEWAKAEIGRVLDGEGGFANEEGTDPFSILLGPWRAAGAGRLYERTVAELFRGRGDVEVWAIKAAEGEFGLRVSAGEGASAPYFGLINIGDGTAFRKHLEEQLGIKVKEDALSGSLFDAVGEVDSPIKLLIGSKKFIEGWSSWRVSTMALLNIGRGQGAQVIQLFGRGVRLRGLGQSLKRSKALPGDEHPPWLPTLETLYIFGWNADYIQEFRNILDREGVVSREVQVPVRGIENWPDALFVPTTPEGYASGRAVSWTLYPDVFKVRLDRRPVRSRLSTSSGNAPLLSVDKEPVGGETVGGGQLAAVVDHRRLWVDLVRYCEQQGYGNLAIPKPELRAVVEENCLLLLPEHHARDPERLQVEATAALCSYVDRFYARREREDEGSRLAPARLNREAGPGKQLLLDSYRVRARQATRDAELRGKLDTLLNDPAWGRDSAQTLPRLYFSQHLYNPLLLESQLFSISPPPLNAGEQRVVEDVREFWRASSDLPEYQGRALYMLRNLSQRGVVFFRRSGFYPDFILWLVGPGDAKRVVFLEPHGMEHEQDGVECDKLKAMSDLAARSGDEAFASAGLSLDGFLVTETPRERIVGADGLPWDALVRDHRLICLAKAEDLGEDGRARERARWVPVALRGSAGSGGGELPGGRDGC